MLQDRLPIAELITLIDRARASGERPGLDRRALACLARASGTGRPCRLHRGAPAAVLLEQVRPEDAVQTVLMRHRQLQDRFPGKPVVIAEVGWPSGGETRGAAVGNARPSGPVRPGSSLRRPGTRVWTTT
jgi:hypothetical protein